MLKKLVNIFSELDAMTFKIMRYGLKFCFLLCMISIILLVTYNLNILSPFFYYVGINLFELSLVFGIEFIICAIVVDGIKKQMI